MVANENYWSSTRSDMIQSSKAKAPAASFNKFENPVGGLSPCFSIVMPFQSAGSAPDDLIDIAGNKKPTGLQKQFIEEKPPCIRCGIVCVFRKIRIHDRALVCRFEKKKYLSPIVELSGNSTVYSDFIQPQYSGWECDVKHR